ncbi:MAG: prepilin-type N-terminal cleavage/methylation domain-containing protein [Candidatus Aminicenantes bacterium]|nr:prepilin-type N-terminal cleavage/methylation domain-containing protein [Candidatus Aminicenantes bacterium]
MPKKQTARNKQHRDRRGRCKGITFIELLVSFALMTVFILGMTELIIYSLSIHDKAGFHIKSQELATTKLEYLKSLPFDHVELEEHKEQEVIVVNEKKYLVSWTIQNEAEGLKRVDLECSAASLSSRKTEISIYISKGLGF